MGEDGDVSVRRPIRRLRVVRARLRDGWPARALYVGRKNVLVRLRTGRRRSIKSPRSPETAMCVCVNRVNLSNSSDDDDDDDEAGGIVGIVTSASDKGEGEPLRRSEKRSRGADSVEQRSREPSLLQTAAISRRISEFFSKE